MSERKGIARITIPISIGIVLSVSLFAASLTAKFLISYYNRIYFQMLAEICQEIIEKQPEAEQAILLALKEVRNENHKINENREIDENNEINENREINENNEITKTILQTYGYRQTDFWQSAERNGILLAVVGFFISGILFFFTLFFWRRKEIAQIKTLTDYLERINTGGRDLLFPIGEEEVSKLQDEIYKTVTMLYQTRDAALDARNHFAENLSNIAHQMKTPITSILLSIQMMKDSIDPSQKHEKDFFQKHLEQIHLQLSRLTHLEEALLLLSRIDSGTLVLERKEVDVFTLLMLAADNLQELFQEADVSVSIPESGEMRIEVDLDWTMEAVMNLFKNCMEHTQSGGMVSCSYEQNLLYTQIQIWDSGAGFAKEDMPYLFERFYRGKNANSGGIGIGLALSKAIIERQNGTICAKNLTDGGACFELRFYNYSCSHSH